MRSCSHPRLTDGPWAALALAVLLGAARRVPAHAQTAGSWQPLGPSGGVISALAAPGSSTVVAGSAAGGIARSADAAAHWSAVSPLDVPVQGALYALLADPVDPAILYADTGTVWKSFDAGATWTLLFNPAQPVTALALSPVNHLRLYAVLNGTAAYRSDDGGVSWTPAGTIAPSAPTGGYFTFTVIADPFDAGTAFAATNGGVLATTDGGATWTPAGLVNQVVQGLAADPAAPGTLYAWIFAFPTYPGAPNSLWTTHDSGQTWTAAAVDFCCQLGGMTVVPRSGAASSLYVAGERASALGHGFLGRSEDAGATWAFPLGSWLMTALAVEAGDPRQIYVGVQRTGVLRTLDGGATWAAATAGLAALRIPAVTVDPFKPGRLYATTGLIATDLGVVTSPDSGATWSRLDHGLDALIGIPLRVVADPTQPGVLYAPMKSGDSNLAKTVDGSADWRNLNLPFAANGLAVDPQRPQTLYAVGRGFSGVGSAQVAVLAAARSADGGATWVGLNARLGLANAPGAFNAVAFDPRAPHTVVIVGDRSFRSTDAGATWTDLPFTAGIAAVAFDPQGNVYAADPPNNRVLVSHDDGANWESRANLPAGTNPRALAVLHPNRIYLAGDTGAFVSTDRGQTWSPLAPGLPAVPILSLAVDPRTAILYAGTSGQGLFAFTPR